ncbi:cation diffusion facilitator family transporter [Hyphomicrobium sp.]|uniref:cation diffusion facilitator family transporter n=1 Tax=Hyphomicrobium sp. TaxID=82 RepID=UPI0025BAAA40|nr:cation diffusion facilitator family transporter [Hyphomicrobium sp.]MCC7253689.1 cation diffusion facilitator family transporter [Hyphomicrobium sp.]
MAPASLRGVLIVALAANAAAAFAGFVGAAWSGSSALLAVALLAGVSAANQGLMLLNIGRAWQPADAAHPFGYAKELYFWSVVVAILLFSLAAGVALQDGIAKLVDPRPVTDVRTTYIVLALALVLLGLATGKAVSELKRRRGDSAAALRASRVPVLFTISTQGLAALASLAVAGVGLVLTDATGRPAADGYAAVLIALLLGAVAAVMSIEVRSLILGEAASPPVRREIHEAVVAEVGPGHPIRAVNEIRTLALGPRSILVVASVDFEDGMPAAALEAAVARIERTIRSRAPAVRRIFIEGQSARDHADAEKLMAQRPAKRLASATTAPKQPGTGTPVALLSVPNDPQAASEPARRLSRKERKRQKHKGR